MVLFARRVVTMIESTGDLGSAMKIAVGILSAVYAVTFFCGALLHLGVRIPLGAAVLAEPTILPAAIVESLCGSALSRCSHAGIGPGPRSSPPTPSPLEACCSA